MSTEIGHTPAAAPADWVPGPPQGQWTYKDYAALPDDGNRYEVLSGVLYMAPAPDAWHQEVSTEIFYHLYVAVRLTRLGKIYSSPLDVMLDAKNTFQPDILVVFNEHLDRITKRGVVGAPDLVVEIASPSTARIDLSEKLSAYASAGVPEYWVVNPDSRTVEVFVLKHGIYNSLGIYYGPAVLPSRIIPNLNVKV
ncbi:MAG: Uma2 family endonuclease, partial [Chloroflexi bacterium]|nr:Uma2 family endonuclease [Chloroflexota bacterium]